MTSFILRPLHHTDRESIAEQANNWEIAKNLMDRFPHPYSFEHAEKFIQMASNSAPVHIKCIDIAGSAVGCIGIHPMEDIFCRNAELGYWLGQKYWGQGIISNAVAMMVEYGFANFDIDRIFARPFNHNIASQKVLEKNGFKLEAKLSKTIFKKGIYHDEFIYSILKKP